MVALAKISTTAATAVKPAVNAVSGRQKAAIIVRLLLAEGTGVPLSSLPEDMQTALAEQIGAMRSVDRDTLRAVIAEFTSRLDSVGLSFPGDLDSALDLLQDHLSADAASRMRQLARGTPSADPWHRVAALEDAALVAVLEGEAAEVAAVVLSKLPVPRAAELLGQLPGKRARQVAHAVSLTAGIAPEMVRRIGQALAAQFATPAVRAFETDPHERIGAILNLSRATTREEVLNGLGEEDSGFAEQVRRAIFTFTDIPARVEGRDVARVLRAVEQPVIVTALAGARSDGDRAAAEFLLANMSQRLAATLREEMAERGTISERDAEGAMTAIIASIRDRAAEGEITLKTAEEDAAGGAG